MGCRKCQVSMLGVGCRMEVALWMKKGRFIREEERSSKVVRVLTYGVGVNCNGKVQFY